MCRVPFLPCFDCSWRHLPRSEAHTPLHSRSGASAKHKISTLSTASALHRFCLLREAPLAARKCSGAPPAAARGAAPLCRCRSVSFAAKKDTRLSIRPSEFLWLSRPVWRRRKQQRLSSRRNYVQVCKALRCTRNTLLAGRQLNTLPL